MLRVHEPSKLMEWFILSSYEAFRVLRVNFEKKLQSRFEQIFNELCTRVIYNNCNCLFCVLNTMLNIVEILFHLVMRFAVWFVFTMSHSLILQLDASVIFESLRVMDFCTWQLNMCSCLREREEYNNNWRKFHHQTFFMEIIMTKISPEFWHFCVLFLIKYTFK